MPQRIGIGAQSQGNGSGARQNRRRKQNPRKQRGIAAEGGQLLDFSRFFFSESQRDRGTSAVAEQGAKTGEDGKDRAAQGNGGDLYRVAGLPDEKGVGHIVNNHHQHDDDGRQTQVQQQSGERAGFQHFTVFIWLSLVHMVSS